MAGGDEVLADPGEPLVPGDDATIFGGYPLVATDADGQTVPVVTTAGDYKYVGRLVLRFDAAGELIPGEEWNDLRSRNLRVADAALPGGVEEDPFVVENVYTPVSAYVAGLEAEVIGTSEVALNGVRPDIRIQETNLGNLVADAHVNAAVSQAAEFGFDLANPVVGMQNGGGIRNNNVIPAGDITELDDLPDPAILELHRVHAGGHAGAAEGAARARLRQRRERRRPVPAPVQPRGRGRPRGDRAGAGRGRRASRRRAAASSR